MKRLTQVGQRTGTDKATHHGFTEIYDEIFSKYESPRILEIGVYSGASIRMYLEYFNNPYVVGMDSSHPTQFGGSDAGFKFVQGNQADIVDLQKCVDDEEPFDIILDDGGHRMHEQQIAFGYLFKHVKRGGYYILEDIHTSFAQWFINEPTEPLNTREGYQYTTYEMLKKVEQKELGFSKFIDTDTQQYILDNIDTFQMDMSNPNSITCIMKVKP